MDLMQNEKPVLRLGSGRAKGVRKPSLAQEKRRMPKSVWRAEELHAAGFLVCEIMTRLLKSLSMDSSKRT